MPPGAKDRRFGTKGSEMAVSFDFDAVLVHEQPRAVRPFQRAAFAKRSALDPTCLVVSGDASLRKRLGAAAELSGWAPSDAPVGLAGLKKSLRNDFQLVIVDLVSPLGGDRSALETVVAELADRPDTMLVVFGAVDCDEHEVWARSKGAFVHLPGVAAGDSLVSLFSEARSVAERRNAPPAWGSAPVLARRLSSCVGG